MNFIKGDFMKILRKTFLFGVCASATVMAYSQTEFGMCSYGSETVDNITCFGPANLNGTNVTGSIHVYGPLTLTGATVNTVDVKGEMTSVSSTIKGNTSVFGPIFATNTSFANNVFSATNNLELNNSKVSGDITEKSSSETGIIKMTNGSVISGSVDFSAKSGVVKIDNTSSIGGSVVNGTKEPI